MDLQRTILMAALLLVSLGLWNAWQKDYPPIVATTSNISTGAAPLSTIPTSVASKQAQISPSTAVLTPSSSANTTKIASLQNNTGSEQLIHVRTDVMDVIIDPHGGNVVHVSLLQYPESRNNAEPFLLLNTSNESFYIAESGLLGNEGPDTAQGQAVYRSPSSDYTLEDNQKVIAIPLKWKNKQGIEVTKTLSFDRGSYAIRVNYNLQNNSQTPWVGQFYSQISKKDTDTKKRSLFNITSYNGAAISSADKRYEKISFSKMTKENLDRSIKGGWAAMQQHYFLSAWIPPSQTETFQYYSRVTDDVYSIGFMGAPIQVLPKQQLSTGATLYAGPELMDTLKGLAPGLDLTIDFGWLWFISLGIFWLMKQIYQLIGNWGWSIVLVTFIIKALFYKLSERSYKSMAAMRQLQPRMLALKERYGDDKQKMSQATMELYKSEKINPLGGCLPILVQIPVFIALYWVLLESVELRQAPFIGWIQDLSVKDPYYILPVVMGLTLLLQQRLNPQPTDPVQAKVMLAMPVIMTILFVNFPAGLVLYWVVNNALSILQQWLITMRIERLGARKKNIAT
jgi:YidC/Oxa1 family membrane protein insertase